MRLRALIRGFGFDNCIGFRFDVVMALAGAVDAIGPVEAGVEPLRRVRRRDLPRQHEAELIEKGLSVINSVEIMVLPTPIGPGAGETVKDLNGRVFRSILRRARQSRECGGVGLGAPKKRRDAVFFDTSHTGWNPGSSEIFLGEDICRDLAPIQRNLNFIEGKDHRSVRVADFAF